MHKANGKVVYGIRGCYVFTDLYIAAILSKKFRRVSKSKNPFELIA